MHLEITSRFEGTRYLKIVIFYYVQCISASVFTNIYFIHTVSCYAMGFNVGVQVYVLLTDSKVMYVRMFVCACNYFRVCWRMCV